MRYMIVTYDEAGLPSKQYDLFEVLGRFLTEEGLNCALADMHAPSEVMDYVAPSRSLLEKLLVSVEIVNEELGASPIPNDRELQDNFEAAQDELTTMRAMLEEELALNAPASSEITGVWFDEAATIPYLIPPAHQESPLVIVGEESCEKVNS